MSLRPSILLVALGFALLPLRAAPPPPLAPPRLNILLIIADDLGTRLGCYGDPVARTPHLDRFAASAVRFDRAYCQFPLCGPSRASFLTGRLPAENGVRDNLDEFRKTLPETVTLPQLFRQHGWFTARVGKLHHQGVPGGIGKPGVDDPPSWVVAINPRGSEKDEEKDLINPTGGSIGSNPNWGVSPSGDLEHTDGIVASEAIRLLREHRASPFFIAAGFYRPHTPYTAPKAWFDQFAPADQLPITIDDAAVRAGSPAAAWNPPTANYGLPVATLREAARAYHAATAYMDFNTGRILDELDRLGLSANTIVVFLGDHGYHLGEHGNWAKRSLFEESARVPFILRVPGVTGNGHVVAPPVEMLDLYRTLADLAQLTPDAAIGGRSLRPQLENPAALTEGAAYTEVNRYGNPAWLGRSLRTARWRYTEWDFGRQGTELYDHDQDPRERHNLADEPALAATRAALQARLHARIRASEPSALPKP